MVMIIIISIICVQLTFKKQILNNKVRCRLSMKRLTTLLNIVINTEEQFSIWPSYKPLPAGWKNALT